MPTIFAIDGAEDFGFSELGAYSSAVASLQTALIALGQKVGDATLAALVLDGLIGPKTTAATNRAFAMYVGGAPANLATGTLTQSQVSTNAASLASYVNAELQRRGATKTIAPVTVAPPAALAPAPVVSDSSAQIVKYAAIGLGGVVVASVLYMLWRRQQGRPAFGGDDDRPSQRDMFYRAGRQRAEADQTFLHMVKTGLTAPELEKLIAKRPSVWAKYRDWIRILPKRHGVGPDRFKGSLGALPQHDADAIESMMDRSGGVSEVFDTMSEIARGKAEHVETNWQDSRLARRWEAFARKMDKLASSTKGFELGDGFGGSTRKYNAIARVTGKTRDGWSTSWGLRSVTGIEASSESEARRAAMAIWRKRGEWPKRGKRYDPKSLRLHVTVAEGY